MSKKANAGKVTNLSEAEQEFNRDCHMQQGHHEMRTKLFSDMICSGLNGRSVSEVFALADEASRMDLQKRMDEAGALMLAHGRPMRLPGFYKLLFPSNG